MSWFFPIETGKTLFDLWSVVHFAGWMALGANCVAGNLPNWAVWTVLASSTIIWEIVERTLLKHMIQHPESMINSFIGDPISNSLGFCFGVWLAHYISKT
jgi:hypothetical protein